MYDNQPIEKGQSYNIFRDEIDDSVLVKQYGLNPKVAYTPQINAAIVNAQHGMTYQTLIGEGETPKKAKMIADSHRDSANKRVSAAIKNRKKYPEQ